MTAEAAKARIESWLAPISEAAPAGPDARYESLHEVIRNEAAKLETPTTGLPDWEKILKDAEKLTKELSKDLLIESYAAFALFQVEGLMGLASGFYLLAESMDRYWADMWPGANRLRARVNAISWLTERLDTTLGETAIGPDDHDAVAALEDSVKRLRGVVGEKFEDQAPALRPVSDTVERLKMSLPERAAGAAPDDGPDTEPPPPSDGGPAPTDDFGAAAPADAAPAAEAEPEPAPAEPEAPKEASADDLAAELIEKAKEWTQPIPGDAPAGEDAKYEPEHEELRNDIAALDTPTGGNLDWTKVVPRSGNLLRDKSKDLLIASYLAFGLWETRQVEGLAVGLEVIRSICENQWEDCFPPARRIRGRANALSWLLERLEQPVPEATLNADSKHEVALLEVAVKRFAEVVREKFEDAAPSIRPLQDNVQRLKMSIPEPAAAAPPPPPRKAAAPAAQQQQQQAPRASAPRPSGGATADVALGGSDASLANPAEVGKFVKEISKPITDAAKMLFEAAPADPNSYQFLRLGLALGQTPPKAEGSETRVPAPQDTVVSDLEKRLADADWENLLKRAEAALRSKRFWLDPHRYAALALANMGPDYASARDAVIAGCAFFVKQYPELLDLTFAGGLPFASQFTKEWIQVEVMPSGGGGGGGDGGEGSDVIAEARGLAGAGKLAEALERLEGLAYGARNARARFMARLAMAQTLAAGDTAKVADGIFSALAAEAEAVGLDSWEPTLAAECYRSHLACLKQAKAPDEAAVAAVFRRLCRVDPTGAMKA